MTTTQSITTIDSVTLDVPDVAAAEAFYEAAFGLTSETIGLRAVQAATSGFRGFTLSLVVSQPATVDEFVRTTLEAGATTLKPVKKSLWGYGGVVCAPDGTIWKVATSSKKNKGPANRQIDDIALLLGVADVVATKRFYVERGLQVEKSFGRKYVQFATASGRITLGLYGRAALAKDAGVPVDGDGSHGLAICSSIGPFTDPDGFAWEAV
jgi:predicted lactoylglutathione lyase